MEKSGWGLDLDDGATNYEIYNNISVGGISMKLREGAYRKVYNNIWYLSKGAFGFHVETTITTISIFSQHHSHGPRRPPNGRMDGQRWLPRCFTRSLRQPANRAMAREGREQLLLLFEGRIPGCRRPTSFGSRQAESEAVQPQRRAQSLVSDEHSALAQTCFLLILQSRDPRAARIPALKLRIQEF